MRKEQFHSEEAKRKISETLRGRHVSKDWKRKISEALKGKLRSEEHRRNLSKAMQGRVSPMEGKHHTEESKLKMSKAKKGTHLLEEVRRKRAEDRRDRFTGENSPTWKGGKTKIICKGCGKSKYVFPCRTKDRRSKFCSRKCLGIWTIKHMKKKDTYIELAIERELIKRHIPFMKQTPLEGITIADFLLPNRIIIQCDGDYWHSKTINKGRDIAQDTVLHFKGYKVYRLTETEIKKSAKKCVGRIIKDV